jgi:hypothetical protein
MISKLLRLYKRSHGLRQICNIAVYIAHSACTIHLLNLPEKNARRDIIHGVKHLEEVAEGWLCARRTLGILSVLAKKWKVELPEEAATVLARTDSKFGSYGEAPSPSSTVREAESVSGQQRQATTSPVLPSYSLSMSNAATPAFFDNRGMPINTTTTSEAMHRNSEARSLPPNDANSLTYPRAQRNPSTPGSNGQRPTDSNTNSDGNSPSQLFGGVDQLLRDSQDWWLRDQSQLAVGFDNWNLSADEMAWLSSTPAGIGSPVANGYTTSPVTHPVDLSGGMNGNVNRNSNGTVNGLNGVNSYGGVLNTYNEQDWYQ